MAELIIQVENAGKQYKETKALDQVSLKIEKGKIYGLIGRNGSGKTVLLKAICGVIKLTEGTVKINGKLVGKEIDIPDNIGVMIETPGFLNNFTGYENLKYLASIKKKIGKEEIRAAITRVGLDPDMKKWVGKYSLGMRQRLGIAQAIMEDPEILILDEPTNGLDKSGVCDFRNLMKELRENGKTIILASHNAEDIGELCDEVFELEAGRLIPQI